MYVIFVSYYRVTVAFYNAITFGVYAEVMRRMSKNDRNDILNHGIAGTISGIARTFVISPVEVVKVQMQVVGQEKPMNTRQCIRYIYQKAGFGGFSRGYLMCFMREPVAFATYFASFEWMTKYVFGFAVLPTSQCGNLRNFLSFRFYVKSSLMIFELEKQPFLHF